MLNRLANLFVRGVERWMPDIARLSIRDIMGYCVMTFLLSAALSTLVLFLSA